MDKVVTLRCEGCGRALGRVRIRGTLALGLVAKHGDDPQRLLRGWGLALFGFKCCAKSSELEGE